MNEGRQRWVVLISLAFIEIFMFGPSVGTIGVFITPLVNEFHWSHAQVSRIATFYEIGLGSMSLVAGYLLDRVNARWVMAAGGVVGGVGYLLASTTHSLDALLAAYVMVGGGVALAALVPATVVAVNWFPGRRSLAIAIATSGVGIGMATAPRIVTEIIASHGWRAGMVALGLPMLIAVVPTALLLVRTRPEQVGREQREKVELPGLEVGGAVRTLSFWLLLALSFLSQTAVGAVYFHTIPFLINAGFSPDNAAMIFGGQALLVGPGGMLLGALADHFTPKPLVIAAQLLLAVGVASLLSCASPALGAFAMVGYIIFWGIDMGAGAVIPVLVVDTLGLRRFGTFTGIGSMMVFAGQATGPLITGRLFDMTGSYTLPFEIAMLIFACAATVAAVVFPAEGHDQIPASAASARPASPQTQVSA